MDGRRLLPSTSWQSSARKAVRQQVVTGNRRLYNGTWAEGFINVRSIPKLGGVPWGSKA